ncbi:glycosyltransferase [Glaciecola sp. MH2013]|uniref:glycosyltransferase n=1 Tax=Glaciecola sp. MH2013 TaxID=2785524 RepID=UPI00189FE536|nr:glycosyltransferase [Glaciecola sp. MH2013]MBF7072170.1 glycosyltransferase [Glaciecola sp. MH2013]
MSAPLTAFCSFIIPHYGREEMLVDTLASVSRLSLKDDNSEQHYEVEAIVVTKNTKLKCDLEVFANKLNVRVINAPMDVTISAQRNMGVAAANGNYLAFLDADIDLAPNWLLALLPQLNEQVKLVSAVQLAANNAPPLEILRTELSNAHTDCTVEFLPGRNLLMSAETFAISGGFPEHLVTCEDYVFTQKVAEQGDLFYSTASNYVHLGEDKVFNEMAKKEVWRGQSNLASLKGRKVSLSEYPSFIAPPAFTFGLLGFIVFAMLSLTTLSIVSLLGAILVLGLYSLRLYRIAKPKLSLATVIKFYALYFPARTWGTILGIVKPIQTSSHK